MTPEETDDLLHELEEFRAEKEKIRSLVGQIGGKGSATRDRWMNIGFIVALSALLVMDILRHLHLVHIPLPAVFSLEVGILLVSVKIIWMIHKQTKVEHFQFWILHSIEFRLNGLANRLRSIEENTAPGSKEKSSEAEG